MHLRVVVILILGASAWAQSLDPELAPIAAKHKTDLAMVETQKVTALARARQDYLAALDFADKGATSAGDLKATIAIGKERDLVKAKPDLPLSFPADLPTSLLPARKACLNAIGSATADAQKRAQQIDSDYLRTLGMLSSNAASNPTLTRQIAAEKAELIQRETAATTPAAPAVANASSVSVKPGSAAATPSPVLAEKLVNGNFADADANDFPTGWSLCGGLGKGGVLPDGVSIKIVKENGLSFLRMTFDGRFHDCGIKQEIAVPNRARSAVVKIWYRGKVTGRLNPTDRRGWPNYELRFFNEKGDFLGHGGAWTENVTNQPAYKTVERTIPIPDGGVKATLSVQNGNCTGVFDFEHAEISYK